MRRRGSNRRPFNGGGRGKKQKGSYRLGSNIRYKYVDQKETRLDKAELSVVRELVKEKKEKEKAEIKKVDKTLKMDPRIEVNVKTQSNDQLVDTISPAQTFDVPIKIITIAGMVAPIVCYAVARGFVEFAAEPSYVYWSLCYATKVLANYTQNVTPKSTDVPYWISVIGNALTNKTVVNGLGKLCYKYDIDSLDESTVPWEMDIGPTAYTRKVSFGIVSSTAVNTHLREIVAPNAYSEVEGEKAFTSLSQFLAQLDKGKTKMHEKVPSNIVNKYAKDISAYAVNTSVMGSGFNGLGGTATNLQCEVAIFTPILSCLSAANVPGGDKSRFQNKIHAFGGDSFYCGGLLGTFLEKHQVRVNYAPITKQVDFLELGNVMCLYLKNLVQEYVNTDEFKGLVNNTPTLLDVTLPLSLQEFLIALRAQVMSAFMSSQHIVQSVYTRLPTGSSDNQFVAYASGVGLSPFNLTGGMFLPISFVENVRALTAVELTSGKRKKNPQIILPQLGQYYLDELKPEDYTVTVQVGESTQVLPIFLSHESAKPKVTIGKQKGKEPITKTTTEEVISLIDGKSASGRVAINDPGAVNFYTVLYNEWIKRFESFSQTTSTIGIDGGISILRTLPVTTHWTPVQAEVINKRLEDVRYRNRYELSSTDYSQRQIGGISYGFAPLKAVVTSCWQYWVTPVNLMQGSNNLEMSTPFQRYSSAVREPFQECVYLSNSPSTLAMKHSMFAKSMVKTKFGRKNNDEEFLLQAAELGRGGILNSLTNAVAGPLLKIGTGALMGGLQGFLS